MQIKLSGGRCGSLINSAHSNPGGALPVTFTGHPNNAAPAAASSLPFGLVRERFFTPRVAVQELRRAKRLAARSMRCLTKDIATGSSPSRRCGRYWRRRGPSSFPMRDGSMASMRCRLRSPRPVWFASTTTSTRWRLARSDVQSRYMPMRIAS